MAGKPRGSKNKVLLGGISRYSRSAMYRRKFLYKRKKIAVKAEKKVEAIFRTKDIKGEDNGKTRNVLLKKSPRFYPTEDFKRRVSSRKHVKQAKLRSSITPGTVLILLAGRHMGKRVVFLKQLESGLLLVTGPFAANGVPLRRVCQTYVISTSTSIDISTLNIPERINDDYFRRASSKKDKGDIFADSKKSYSVNDDRKEDQRNVDTQLLTLIKKVPSLRQYLGSRFSLKHGQFPHKMIF
uniref:Large ribosomal subunit protein eL6 n=1 Tax=Suberites domuncula TaxID=55567 RepID=Q4KTI2_SUBDO|nr:L6 [Suberites domuncula]